MKKTVFLFLSFILCALFALIPALAEDYTLDAFTSFTYMVRSDDIPLQDELPETFRGKAVFGLYYDLFSDPLEISSVALKEQGEFYMLPEEYLAGSIDDADWAFLIYASEKENPGEDEIPFDLMIFPVDAKNAVFYRPYVLDSRDTFLEDDSGVFDLGPALRGWYEFVLQPEWDKLHAETDEYFRQGMEFFADEKYFSAYEAFLFSSSVGSVEKGQECIRPWPENGEIWRSSSIGSGDMELILHVNQDESRALAARIFLNGECVSCLFIGGTGEAKTLLPGGVYMIKDGSGEMWFGTKETFGRYGSYETMTFGDDAEETLLESGYTYTITVNVEDSDPEADGVGSDYEDWEGFSE